MSNDDDDCDELETAFVLISMYKRGEIAAGSSISERQDALLRRLRADLLPDLPEPDGNMSTLIVRLGEEDSRWNRRTMKALCDIDDLRQAGKGDEADALRQSFLRDCPSTWYNGIVSA